jgi:hypothetical protein
MDKNNFIKNLLLREIKSFKKRLKEEYADYHRYLKDIPDDPSLGVDVFHDGVLNENPYLKATYLEGKQHIIGYLEGAIHHMKQFIYYLDSDLDKIKSDILKDKEISKENKKMMNDLLKRIKSQRIENK